jgi:site-specific DNA-cytosine methylase
MGFPEDFLLPDDPKLSKHLLGNAVVPNVAEWITGKVAEWAA